MMQRETRSLPVKLAEGQRDDRARRAASILSQRDEVETAAKIAAKEAKARVDALEAEIRKLSSAAREGVEHQDVTCEWQPDVGALKMQLVRTDTDEVIFVRDMTKEERQQELPVIEVGSRKRGPQAS